MGSHCLKAILSGLASGPSETTCRVIAPDPPAAGVATSSVPSLASSSAASRSFLLGSSATTFPEGGASGRQEGAPKKTEEGKGRRGGGELGNGRAEEVVAGGRRKGAAVERAEGVERFPSLRVRGTGRAWAHERGPRALGERARLAGACGRRLDKGGAASTAGQLRCGVMREERACPSKHRYFSTIVCFRGVS